MDYTSLPSNTVTALFKDSRRILWVGAGGLGRYDRLRDRFERILLPEGSPAGQLSGTITDIKEDHQGDIWIAFKKAGLYRMEWHDPDHLAEGQTVKGTYRLEGLYPFAGQPKASVAYPE